MNQRSDLVLGSKPLGFAWQTRDPFLFSVHHDDAYPAGNDRLGPAASLAGRSLGQDFDPHNSWRMYHGRTVPGFPYHPHRGFETVTIVRRGLLDHSDSLGAAARFGEGDVQWLTAGKGILHSEMFPLLNQDRPNPVELFQIWVNLPRADKLAEPHFTMLWSQDIPRVVERDEAGRAAEIAVIAGRLGEHQAPAPPPRSWASRPDSDFAILTIKLDAGATWTLPAARPGSNRSLYLFQGTVKVGGRAIPTRHDIDLRPDAPAPLEAGPAGAELLLLQARPIGEPVVQHGPFVMNSQAEILQTMREYQQTQFGGWSWPSSDPVHPRGEGRFARYPDGRIERPG